MSDSPVRSTLPGLRRSEAPRLRPAHCRPAGSLRWPTMGGTEQGIPSSPSVLWIRSVRPKARVQTTFQCRGRSHRWPRSRRAAWPRWNEF